MLHSVYSLKSVTAVSTQTSPSNKPGGNVVTSQPNVHVFVQKGDEMDGTIKDCSHHEVIMLITASLSVPA